MRLTDDETRIIRDTVRRRFGSNARVWLTSRAFKSKRFERSSFTASAETRTLLKLR